MRSNEETKKRDYEAYESIKGWLCPLAQTLIEGQCKIFDMTPMSCIDYDVIEHLEEYIKDSMKSDKWRTKWIKAIGEERYNELIEVLFGE